VGDEFDAHAGSQEMRFSSQYETALRDWRRYLLLFLAFVVPIQPLLDIRSYRLVEAAVLVLGGLAIYRHRANPFPWTINVSLLLGLAGWSLATAFSRQPIISFDVGILEFCMFYILLYVFTTEADAKIKTQALILFVLGATLLSVVQAITIIGKVYPIASTWSDIPPVPIRASDFIRYKDAVPVFFKTGVPHSYGNIGSYGSLWILLVPLALGGYFVVRQKTAALLVAVAVIYSGLVVYSRSALVAAMLAAFAIWIFRLVKFRSVSPAITALMLAVVIIHVDPSALHYYSDNLEQVLANVKAKTHLAERGSADVPGASTEVRASRAAEETGKVEGGIADRSAPAVPGPAREKASGEAKTNSAPEPNIQFTDDVSASERLAALRTGLKLGLQHWVTGVGYGAYANYDRVYTAPHSLALLRFAESGVLGLLSFLALFFYLGFRLLRALLTGQSDMGQFTCLAASSAFMLKAAFFGANFAVSSNFVWAFGLALTVAGTLTWQSVEAKYPLSALFVVHRSRWATYGLLFAVAASFLVFAWGSRTETVRSQLPKLVWPSSAPIPKIVDTLSHATANQRAEASAAIDDVMKGERVVGVPRQGPLPTIVDTLSHATPDQLAKAAAAVSHVMQGEQMIGLPSEGPIQEALRMLRQADADQARRAAAAVRAVINGERVDVLRPQEDEGRLGDIQLQEADGYVFKNNGPELTESSKQKIRDAIVPRLLEIAKKRDSDVIEVIGHTDPRPVARRRSNLDRELPTVLRDGKPDVRLSPADNAGMGLARAVAVVRTLREDDRLRGYHILPLSAGSLIGTDGRLSTVPDERATGRRRIEIVLRKSRR
jgi:outer membrane protein OmpA-like peptidoglycan-associated protein